MFTRDRIHEAHRFPGGDLLTCDSWEEQGFQSRGGRTMHCWIESPGSWFREDLGDTWLRDGQTQPDGPNMLAASHRLELHRASGTSALLMDNTLFYQKPDTYTTHPLWAHWRISEDPWTKAFLRALLEASGSCATPAANPSPSPRRLPSPSDPPKPWERYEIASVDVPSLRIVARLRPLPGAAAGLPATLIFEPRTLGSTPDLSLDETLAANPGLAAPAVPADVLLEVKIAETIRGKTSVIRQDLLQPAAGYQTIVQEFHLEGGESGRVGVQLKPAFRIGNSFVYYERMFGLPDPDPVECKLGEWHSGGGAGWPTMEARSGMIYFRAIHRGQQSPRDEVPVIPPFGPPSD